MFNTTKKHILLLSGGLDSTALLAYLLQKGIKKNNIVLVTFQVPTAQNKYEIEACNKISNSLAIKLHIIKRPLYFGKSDMSNKNKNKISSRSSKKGMRQVIIPFRNAYYISMAINYMSQFCKQGIIYIAAHKDDLKFPDCTPKFMNAFRKSIEIGSNNLFTLSTPFLYLTKREFTQKYLVKSKTYNHLIDYSYSCYQGVPGHCQTCMTCIMRKKAISM